MTAPLPLLWFCWAAAWLGWALWTPWRLVTWLRRRSCSCAPCRLQRPSWARWEAEELAELRAWQLRQLAGLDARLAQQILTFCYGPEAPRERLRPCRLA